MQSFPRRFFALLVLAIWLPATMHCGLEAAGLFASDTVETSCCHTHDAIPDGCSIVEQGIVKPASDVSKAPAPLLVSCLCFICTELLTPIISVEPVQTDTAFERPLDWIPAWQFARRAAPLSRAPSLIG